MKELAIIILDWNGAEDTIECLNTLLDYSFYDIYLLDNGSSISNIEEMRKYFEGEGFPFQVRECDISTFENDPAPLNYILSKQNLGFAVGNNMIAQKIYNKYPYILLLNNDTVVSIETVRHMLRMAKENSNVLLTCDIRNYYNKEELWNAGGVFTIVGERKYYSQKKIDRLKRQGVQYIDAEYVTGCALMIKSRYINEHGLFTDRFFHGEEDFNLCYRIAKEKLKVGVDLGTVIYHKVGRTIRRISNSDTDYNKVLVHYSNRVIDFKSLFSKKRWLVWREYYLFLILVLRIAKGMRFDKAFLLRKRIKMISSEYDNVKKDVFDKLMSYIW